MKEIRFHGRGGQGTVIASVLLASAAFKEGKEVQAFPFFGVERRGAPVTAFTRIDNKKIRIRHQIYKPDYVVVLDPTIIDAIDVTKGLKPGGLMLINTDEPLELFKFKKNIKVATIDASEIARKFGLGPRSSPIVNTAILGAFSSFTKLVELKSVLRSIREGVPVKEEENVKAAEEAYKKVTI